MSCLIHAPLQITINFIFYKQEAIIFITLSRNLRSFLKWKKMFISEFPQNFFPMLSTFLQDFLNLLRPVSCSSQTARDRKRWKRVTEMYVLW